MIDLHVHTARCRHATGTAREYVAAARERGVEVLAFTDHLPLLDGSETDYAMPMEELGLYMEEVLSLVGRTRRLGGPEVLLGVEADWVPGQESLLAEVLGYLPLDVVLGSVHFVDGWAFDDPDLVSRYEGRDIDALWRRYFRLVEDSAASGLFDVMAHLDLVKKFGYYPKKDPREAYEHVARTLARHGVAFEVNSAGLRKPCGQLYPSDEFLSALKAEGVPATMGSDAHRPEDVGAGLNEAEEALRKAGYDSVLVFHERVPEERGL